MKNFFNNELWFKIAISVVVFISFYAYYVGYLSYFGITNFKFTFDFDLILQILNNNFILFFLIFFFLFTITNLSDIILTIANYREGFFKKILLFIITILTTLYSFVLLYRYFYAEENKLLILVTGITILASIAIIALRIFIYKDIILFQSERKPAPIAVESKKNFNSDTYNLSIFIFSIAVLPIGFYSLGLEAFQQGRNWTVYKDSSRECIVLIKDQNFVYCAPFNRESNESEKKYRLIPLDELKNGYFEKEELGLMKVR
jgi:hypothetical protein